MAHFRVEVFVVECGKSRVYPTPNHGARALRIAPYTCRSGRRPSAAESQEKKCLLRGDTFHLPLRTVPQFQVTLVHHVVL